MKSAIIKRISFVLIAAVFLSLQVFVLGCSQDEGKNEITETKTETTAAESEKTAATKAEDEPAESIGKTEATAEDKAEANGQPEAEEVFWQFESTDLEGEKITHQYLEDNEVTLVNVWATYCSPCLQEMPDLARVAKEYKDKGVGFLGIVSDIYAGDPDETVNEIAKKMIADANINFTNIIVSDSVAKSIMGGVQAVPTTFFADSKGRLVGKVVLGMMTIEDMRDHIETALAEAEGN